MLAAKERSWSGLTSISGVSTFMTKPGFRSSSHDIRIVLPIKELEPGLGPFSSICMELPTPRGFIDNLLMTSTGDIALIETKLFRNPEATRKVLAQVIDYAGCLFQMTYEQFEHAVLSARAMSSRVTQSFYDLLPEADKPSEHVFHDVASENLRRGRVLILIVGDGIQNNLHTLLGNIRGHAWSSFTLALVELAIFHLPNSLAHAYVEDLAKTWDCECHVLPTSGNWTLYKDGRPLRLRDVLNRLSDWLGPMQRFIAAIQESGRDL